MHTNPVRRPGPGRILAPNHLWPRLLGVGLVAMAALSCGDAGQSDPLRAAPETLSWNRVPGATRYEVRAWSAYRLLLEEATAETTLSLSPTWAATLASFDSVTVQVRAYDAQGLRVGDLQERRWPPADPAR
jgi:hypothetical protein